MADITILDGGMGKELRRIGAPFRQPEWSALAMLEAPEFVSSAHDNFVTAGAQVIITNVYALVPFHIGADRFIEQGRELVALGGRLARQAADRAGHPIRVAGSMPPLFGSYQPESFDAEAAVELWTMFAEEQAPYVDLWLGETMSSTNEFTVLDGVLRDIDGIGADARPVWASFCLFDRLLTTPTGPKALLRSGETVTEMTNVVTALQPDAVLFNCSQPETIGPAIEELVAAVTADGDLDGLRVGGYANAFQPEAIDDRDYSANSEVMERRRDLTVERYADLVGGWVDVGATIVGGCCDIFPDHIAELASRFGNATDGN